MCLFNYLAHPDLYMFDYKSINGKNEFDSKAKEICIKLIDLFITFPGGKVSAIVLLGQIFIAKITINYDEMYVIYNY